MPPVVLRNAADIYQGLTGGEDPITSGITRVAQMLQTKQQRDEAKKQREFENQLQTEAGQRAAQAADRSLKDSDWNRQKQAYELASKAAGMHHGKREAIPFEERAMLNADAAQIPDTPEERAAWNEMKPTRLKAAETFTVRDPYSGQEHQLPLLTASHLAEKQAEEAKATAKTQREIDVEGGTSRKITPEMIATLRGVNPALAELFGQEGDVVPAAELRGVATQLARPEPAGRGLQHVTRETADGSQQVGTFDPGTGAYTWQGGGGGGGGTTAGTITTLEQVPAEHRATVKAMLEYRETPQSIIRGSSRQSDQLRNQLIGWAHNIDPTYDFTQAPARQQVRKEFQSGASAKNLTALNTAEQHIATLEKAAKDLPRHGGMPFATGVNAVQNWLSETSGKPAVTNFNTVRTKVADEVSKAFVGAGAIAEQNIKRELDNLSPNMSEAQYKGTIENLRTLLQGRRNELRASYERGMGGSGLTPEMISAVPDTKEASAPTTRRVRDKRTGQELTLQLVNGQWQPVQ